MFLVVLLLFLLFLLQVVVCWHRYLIPPLSCWPEWQTCFDYQNGHLSVAGFSYIKQTHTPTSLTISKPNGPVRRTSQTPVVIAELSPQIAGQWSHHGLTPLLLLLPCWLLGWWIRSGGQSDLFSIVHVHFSYIKSNNTKLWLAKLDVTSYRYMPIKNWEREGTAPDQFAVCTGDEDPGTQRTQTTWAVMQCHPFLPS